MKTGFSLLEILHRENLVFITGMGLQWVSFFPRSENTWYVLEHWKRHQKMCLFECIITQYLVGVGYFSDHDLLFITIKVWIYRKISALYFLAFLIRKSGCLSNSAIIWIEFWSHRDWLQLICNQKIKLICFFTYFY